MALFSFENHAANPPSTWNVVKAGNKWHLTTKNGGVLETTPTKKKAEALKVSGFLVELYEKERRWYAGESVPGWRPFAELKGK